MSAIAKLGQRHFAIIDWMLANPTSNLEAASKELGYSVPWLSILTNTDLFKAEFARRRQGMEALQHSRITSRLLGVAEAGLENMQTALEGGLASPSQIKEYTDTALEALGYMNPPAKPGANAPAPVAVLITPETMSEARAIIAARHQPALKEVNETPALPVPASA